jgi:hypothetical protein
MIKLKVRYTPEHGSTPWMVPVPKSITGTRRVRKFFATEAEATTYLNRLKQVDFEEADIRVSSQVDRHQSVAERWRNSEWAGSTKKIEQLYAWTATGLNGEEAIIGLSAQGVHCPLIDSDRKRIEALRDYAQEIGKFSGRSIQFVTFQRVPQQKVA